MDKIELQQQKVKATLGQEKNSTDNQQIKVHYSNRWIKIPLNCIIRLKGNCNYTYVYTRNREYITAKTLKDFQSLLCENQFIRIHKSHIVNMSFVKGLDVNKNIAEIKIEGGHQLEVSRRRLKDVKNKLDFFRSN